MSNNMDMYTVKLHTSASELGELISLAGTMRYTTVVCANKTNGDGNGITKAAPKRESAPDPRLVYRNMSDGTKRINVDESLRNLGLDMDWLLANKTKLGTPEHSVKMALARSKDKE